MGQTRRVPRHAFAQTANLHLARGAAGTSVVVRDISMQGCQLERAAGSKVGKNCELYFDWQGKLVGVAAKVVWSDTKGRVGLRYEKIDEYSRNSLRELCDSLQSRRPMGRRAGEENVRTAPAPVKYQATEHPMFPTVASAAKPRDTDAESRRMLPRYISELRGDVLNPTTGKSADVSLVDLSVSGARLEGKELPEAGQSCQLNTEWEGRRMALLGEVAWKTKRQVGLKFSPLDDETARQLRLICASSHLAPRGQRD